MSDTRDLVVIENARLGYGDRVVLDGVTLRVRQGEYWFLLGPNGAGKSTLLKAALGSLRPLDGRVSRRDDVAGAASIGFVPQRCELNPTIPTTVREFVSLGLVGAARSGEPEAQRLRWALGHMRLEGMERRSYWSLSGGQRQRALIARALVRRPALLLVDEPTTGLDLPSQNALMGCLDELNAKERLTVLFVTHDLSLAARHASHVALFYGGGVEAGVCAEILRSARMEQVYGLTIDAPSHRAVSSHTTHADIAGRLVR